MAGSKTRAGPEDMQFKLGTFSAAGGTPFPGLVLDAPAAARRVVPLSLLEPLLRHLNLGLRDSGSILSLLAHWDENLAALTSLCEAAPTELTQGSVVLDDLRTHAPIDPPRQIFCTIANYRS